MDSSSSWSMNSKLHSIIKEAITGSALIILAILKAKGFTLREGLAVLRITAGCIEKRLEAETAGIEWDMDPADLNKLIEAEWEFATEGLKGVKVKDPDAKQ